MCDVASSWCVIVTCHMRVSDGVTVPAVAHTRLLLRPLRLTVTETQTYEHDVTTTHTALRHVPCELLGPLGLMHHSQSN